MPIFKYKAKRSGGETYEGSREAVDKFALYRALKAEGEVVLSTKEVSLGGTHFSLPFKSVLDGVSTRDKIVFARNLGTMLTAGLPLSRALSVIERQSKKHTLKEIVRKISDGISHGETLSAGLATFPNVFSSLFVSMVRVGEESGTLDAALTSVSDQLNRVYLLEKKVRGAMLYPAIIITLMGVIGILMLIYVVPTLTETFTELNVELPASTRFIIFVSGVLQNQTILLIAGALLMISGFWIFKRSAFGKRLIDSLLLRIPIIGRIVRESNAARTSRTLASLLSAGVEVLQAFQITADVVQNSRFRVVLQEAQEHIKRGEPMSEVFAKHEKLYPIFVAEMISIGEETGKLGEMLSNVASFYESEVDQQTKDLSTVIEPFLMVFIGVVVAFFAISMLSPTYSLVNAI